MPLIRRVPKRGFNNHFRKVYSIVNLSVLENFEAGSVVDIETLNEKGLIKLVKDSLGLKVLGNGTVSKALTVKAKSFSAAADFDGVSVTRRNEREFIIFFCFLPFAARSHRKSKRETEHDG